MKIRYRLNRRFLGALLIGILFSCVPVFALDNNPTPAEVAAKDLLPPSGAISGWNIVEGPIFYTPDNLFEIIDGAAPFYLHLGFHELGHARYHNLQDKTLNITLDIYDQSTVEGGFGVYSSSRHPDESFQPWGTQGYRSGALAILWKGKFYISLMGDDERSETIQGLEAFAAWIRERLPGEDVYPKLFDRLPSESRIPNTELYVAEKYLGYRFLAKVASAQYRVQSSTATLFVLECSPSVKTKSLLDRVKKEIGQEEPLPSKVSLPPTVTAYACTDKYLGHMVFITYGNYLYGAFDPEAKLTQELLHEAIAPIVRLSP